MVGMRFIAAMLIAGAAALLIRRYRIVLSGTKVEAAVVNTRIEDRSLGQWWQRVYKYYVQIDGEVIPVQPEPLMPRRYKKGSTCVVFYKGKRAVQEERRGGDEWRL